MKKTLPESISCMSPQLVVSDIEKSIQFYTGQLGFSLNFRHEDFYAGIGCAGNSIHLKTGDPLPGERKAKRKNEDLDISFGVTNVDGFYEHIMSGDVEVIQPLRMMPYGKEFNIIDPDEYILGFLEVT